MDKQAMLRYMGSRGILVINYKDKGRWHDDSIPVFNRRSFYDALGIDVEVSENNTWIELNDAYSIWINKKELPTERRVISITEKHIDQAISSRNWNGTAILLALREQGLGGSVGFRPTPDGGKPELLHTNEKHPTLEDDMTTLGGYVIAQGLLNWMENYYFNYIRQNHDEIKPVDFELVKDGHDWYADIA